MTLFSMLLAAVIIAVAGLYPPARPIRSRLIFIAQAPVAISLATVSQTFATMLFWIALGILGMSLVWSWRFIRDERRRRDVRV